MNAIITKQMLKVMLPALAGVLGTYLATSMPVVYQAICTGAQ